ncbi:hypothetical protein A2V68_01530 [candidate division Kazan bacterium RBG_13_50_9]|uniref:Uncharacterized protein n=1 Tax=candidate division Kazan bacterium RBG_13_50_9 TaxID=1798535 RepID=A0A1F4NRH8_UNCK3|nr:MAG: hypothetical protein A2V68_01530 [candidate division Kazan bacterium RBG_13_50_9]
MTPEGQSWPKVMSIGLQPPDVRGMALPDIARTVIETVASHLETSEPVRGYLEQLPKGPGTSCPDSPLPELVSHVARMVGAQGIDKSNPLINLGWLREIMCPVFQLERQVLRQSIESAQTDGLLLANRDRVLLTHGFTLAEQVDQLFLALFHQLVVPYQSLSEDERKRFAQDVSTQLPEYDYTTYEIQEEDGHYRVVGRVPWAVALPSEIEAVCATLHNLIVALSCEETEMDHYFRRLLLAYDCREVGLLEERWAEVDQAWIQLLGNFPLIPVHGIETYNCPCAVQPEFRLEFRTSEDAGLINEVKLKTGTVASEVLNLPPETVERIDRRMKNTDMAIFVGGIKSGFGLNFPTSGQSAPNRQEVQDIGARIFVTPMREAKALEIYQDLAKRYCDPETAAHAQRLLTTKELRLHIFVHECAHPLGRSAEIDAALGEMSDELEEAKASLVGMLTAELIDNSVESRQARTAQGAIRCIRFFQKNAMNNPSVAPYVRENMVAAITLMDAGVLTLATDGVHIDWEVAGTDAWTKELSRFGSAITSAYASRMPKAVSDVAYCYYDHGDPRLQALIDWCQRETEAVAA